MNVRQGGEPQHTVNHVNANVIGQQPLHFETDKTLNRKSGNIKLLYRQPKLPFLTAILSRIKPDESLIIGEGERDIR